MNQYSKDTLTEYIKHAIDLESAVITQNQIIDAYSHSALQMKPVFNQRELPSPPQYNGQSLDPDASRFMWILIGVGGSFGFGCILIPLFMLAVGSTDLDGFITGLICGFITLLIFFVPGIMMYRAYKRRVSAAWQIYFSQKERYETAFREITEQNDRTKKYYDTNLKQWNNSHNMALNYLNGKLQECQETLQEYYSADVIFPKYRNLPALTTIYEYLCTGRCSELVGPNGAYNLYESELRQNMIITQLNIVISHLEQIKNNQYVLYEEVNKINYNTRRIAAEMSQISGYTYVLTKLTALNTFYSGIAAESASAIAFYQALS